MAMSGSYGGGMAAVDNSLVMKQTFDSLNARESSYNGRLGRFSKGAVESDKIQVRIRGKNNELARHTGSVTRTMNEMTEERKRKQEIAKAANRLKMLEKLEEYRENKMNQEIAQLEAERRREEEELKKARDKERKYAKYLERQKGKLADYAVSKHETMEQQKKEEQAKKKKEKEQAAKFKRDQELKKKQIADYKEKKAITADLLANADLDDYYDEYGDDVASASLNIGEPSGNGGGDPSKYLDNMLAQYKQRAKDSSADMQFEEELLLAAEAGIDISGPAAAGAGGARQSRRPPAVM